MTRDTPVYAYNPGELVLDLLTSRSEIRSLELGREAIVASDFEKV